MEKENNALEILKELSEYETEGQYYVFVFKYKEKVLGRLAFIINEKKAISGYDPYPKNLNCCLLSVEDCDLNNIRKDLSCKSITAQYKHINGHAYYQDLDYIDAHFIYNSVKKCLTKSYHVRDYKKVEVSGDFYQYYMNGEIPVDAGVKAVQHLHETYCSVETETIKQSVFKALYQLSKLNEKANWESPKELLKWAESSTLQEVPSTELENLQNTLRVLAEKLE
jgi:hypothetical protein